MRTESDERATELIEQRDNHKKNAKELQNQLSLLQEEVEVLKEEKTIWEGDREEYERRIKEVEEDHGGKEMVEALEQ